jgi:hypothetical protein
MERAYFTALLGNFCKDLVFVGEVVWDTRILFRFLLNN